MGGLNAVLQARSAVSTASRLARWLVWTAGFWLIGNLLWMSDYLVVGGWQEWDEVAQWIGIAMGFASANALLAMPPMAFWMWLCRRDPGLDLKPLVRASYALAAGLAASYVWLASGKIRQFDSTYSGFVSAGLFYVAWAAVAFEEPRKLVRALHPGAFAPRSEPIKGLPRWFAWRVAAVYLALWAATVPSARAIHRPGGPSERVIAVAPGLVIAAGIVNTTSGHPVSQWQWYAGIAGFHRIILHDDNFIL